MSCHAMPPVATANAEDDEFPGPTTNACKLCTPLGACLAFKGIAGTVPFLHGSQGCATYIRRYLISHFREPMDIAASNFAEHAAIFGGREVLHKGLDNVARQYRPELIGIATTCLSETIGENMPQLLHEYRQQRADADAPPLVHVSTASYRGTHADGFYAAVRALVEQLTIRGTGVPPVDAVPERTAPGEAPPASEPADPTPASGEPIAVFPGFVSAADLRHLREIVAAYRAPLTLVPDYSDTMDGASWADYQRIPTGGTPLAALRRLGLARGAIECGRILAGDARTAGTFLAGLGVPVQRIGLPIGLRETDAFCAALGAFTGKAMPGKLDAARGRLIDAMVDGHKYVFGQRAVVYGEEDFVVGMTSFLCELGIRPVVCASGGRSRRLAATLRAVVPELPVDTVIREGADFADIGAATETAKADILIGGSKGYSLARRLSIPLLRCGFPVHDRLGGHRVLHVGYAGALQLYDALVNLLLERKQANSPIGYSYL